MSENIDEYDVEHVCFFLLTPEKQIFKLKKQKKDPKLTFNSLK